MKTEPIHVICGVGLMNVVIFYSFDRGVITGVQWASMMIATVMFAGGYFEGRRSK